MKKLFLLLFMAPYVMYAQQKNVVQVHATKVHLKNPALVGAKAKYTPAKVDKAASAASYAAKNTGHATKVGNVGTLVGETYYDLQTNSSTYRRIANYGTSQSVVWTFAPSTSDQNYTDRGTGYVTNLGGTWSAPPTAKLEAQRTGFPNLTLLGTSTETVVAHTATPSYNEYISKNSSIGNTSFTGATSTGYNPTGNIWPRAAAVGNNLYVIDCSQDTLSKRAGVHQPVLYSRSTNGGTTWVNDHITLPGYDSTLYYRNGGDNYFLDAKDSIVAIVIGGLANSLVLWKSTDYGVTFTMTNVEPYPVLGYNSASTAVLDTNAIPDGIADTMVTNTGSLSCLIDNNGAVHIWWTTIRNLNDGGGISYFPTGDNELLHWSEATPTTITVIDNFFTTIHDCDGDGSLNIGTNYFTSTANDGDAFYPGEGFITTPQASIDAAGNLFVVYTSVMENDTTVSGVAAVASQNFRDILGAFSTDGGTTWSLPINITKSFGVEDAYPTIARLSDNNLYLSWQADAEPGTALQNGDPIAYNGIMYLAVDKGTFMGLGTAVTDACNDNAAPTQPAADFTWAQSTTDMCTITFTDISLGNPNSWTWVFGDNTTSTAQNPTHTYASPGGLKNVQLVVSNVYGQSSSPVKKVAACIPVGVDNVTSDNNIAIYPNPTSGSFVVNLEGVNAANSIVTVENALGQTISKVENKSGLSKINLDLTAQANGIYFVKVQTATGTSTQSVVLDK